MWGGWGGALAFLPFVSRWPEEAGPCLTTLLQCSDLLLARQCDGPYPWEDTHTHPELFALVCLAWSTSGADAVSWLSFTAQLNVASLVFIDLQNRKCLIISTVHFLICTKIKLCNKQQNPHVRSSAAGSPIAGGLHGLLSQPVGPSWEAVLKTSWARPLKLGITCSCRSRWKWGLGEQWPESSFGTLHHEVRLRCPAWLLTGGVALVEGVRVGKDLSMAFFLLLKAEQHQIDGGGGGGVKEGAESHPSPHAACSQYFWGSRLFADTAVLHSTSRA